jgi:hypothetical protein
MKKTAPLSRRYLRVEDKPEALKFGFSGEYTVFVPFTAFRYLQPSSLFLLILVSL